MLDVTGRGFAVEGGALVVLIVSGIIGFFLMAAAIGVGVSVGMTSTHKHIKRWEAMEEYREAARVERSN